MARRWIPRFVALALVAAAAWWWQQRQRQHPQVPPPPPPDNLLPPAAPEPAWRSPVEGGCPDGFPVKVARSGIFHEPGGRSYDRTTPDRCYAAAADAEADGYRRAKA